MTLCRLPRGLLPCIRSIMIVTVLSCFISQFVLITRGWAQSTVVIGGQGQPSIVVNLDALDFLDTNERNKNKRLLMPGEKPSNHLQLRPLTQSERLPQKLKIPHLSLQSPIKRTLIKPPARRPTKLPTQMPIISTPKVVKKNILAPDIQIKPKEKSLSTSKIEKRLEPQKLLPQLNVKQTVSTEPKTKHSVSPSITAARDASVSESSPIAKPKNLEIPVGRLVGKPLPLPPPDTSSNTISEKQIEKTLETETSIERQVKKEEQIAALSAFSLPKEGGQILSLEFLGASTRLTSEVERLLASLAATMKKGDGRLQLKAYAGGSGETLSFARRLSLSRALSVRSFLIEKGIRSTRIDVRALGRAEDSRPAERVDIVLLM